MMSNNLTIHQVLHNKPSPTPSPTPIVPDSISEPTGQQSNSLSKKKEGAAKSLYPKQGMKNAKKEMVKQTENAQNEGTGQKK
ncbi:hypothetical protein Tco_0924371 [Tanacetum coccineum]|uniref:Uncharacterized protein n=1 Tax=Tanacetum coccineum TaxID=301880 RepID=A0ABQ5D531_9ASTR